MDTLAFLQRLQELGFLFHGSPLCLEEIEPRKGRDNTSEIGRQTAVYAANDYRLAVVKAVLRPCAKDSSYGWSRAKAGLLYVRGYGVDCGAGYVHVLNAYDFHEVWEAKKFEIISFTSVRPVQVIAVNEKSMMSLPNSTFEIAKDFLTPPNF